VDWKNGGRQAGRNVKTTMRESEPNRESKRERRVKGGVGPSDVRQSAGRSHTFIYLVARAADLQTQLAFYTVKCTNA